MTVPRKAVEIWEAISCEVKPRFVAPSASVILRSGRPRRRSWRAFVDPGVGGHLLQQVVGGGFKL